MAIHGAFVKGLYGASKGLPTGFNWDVTDGSDLRFTAIEISRRRFFVIIAS